MSRRSLPLTSRGTHPMWVRLPWGRLRVYVSGSGPVVLVLHGLGGSGRYWEGLARELAGEASIIAPDLAGFGASDKPPVRYDRGFHLDNLDAVVDAIGVGQARVVIGHSMGGILGALWAARHPAGVRALSLVASPYPTPRAPRPERTAYGVQPLLYRVLQSVWPIITIPYRSSVFPRGVILDYPRHTTASYWRTAFDLLWDESVIAELAPLASLRQRRLLLYARDDRQVPLFAQQQWARLLPGASVEVLENGGHQLLLASHFRQLAAWIRESIATPSG